MLVHINKGECHDLLCRTRRFTANVNICMIDDEGELVAEAKLASDVQDIVAYLDERELDIVSVAWKQAR